MKEIEIKARITDFSIIEKKLKAIGCSFSVSINQYDEIFLPKGIVITNLPPNAIVLRIRKQNDKFKFTLKKHLTGELDCIEKETEITNYQDFKDSLIIMDYYLSIVVSKQRIKTRFDNINITLDDVEGLGKFIELEFLSEDENVDSIKIQRNLEEFLLKLEIDKIDIINDSYDVMLAKAK